MADQQNRGGKKQGRDNPEQTEKQQDVGAPVNKTQPGHAQDEANRAKYLEETEGRR